MNIWSILGIEATADVAVIKKAYAKRAAECHPEDDPQGFQVLYEAYRQALDMAEQFRRGPSEEEQKTAPPPPEDTPVNDAGYRFPKGKSASGLPRRDQAEMDAGDGAGGRPLVFPKFLPLDCDMAEEAPSEEEERARRTENARWRRLKNSTARGVRFVVLGGALIFGLIFLSLGTGALWVNERDLVKPEFALMDAQSITRELGDISKLDPSFQGKVVHASGLADTRDILHDPVFKITTRAIALERSVEFCQLTEQSKSETREKPDGGKETVTTYTYSKRWVSEPGDSTRFKNDYNVRGVLLPLENYEARAVNVSLGAYRLPPFLISSIRGFKPLTIELSEIRKNILNWEIQWKILLAEPGAHRDAFGEYVHTLGNSIYIGASPAAPRIGDVRVTFRVIEPTPVSIIAKVDGDTLKPFYRDNISSRLSMGVQSLEDMLPVPGDGKPFETWTWAMRIGGTLLVILGFNALLCSLPGNVNFPVLFPCLAWSLAVISIPWLSFRPLAGTAMLLMAGGLTGVLFLRRRKKKTAAFKEIIMRKGEFVVTALRTIRAWFIAKRENLPVKDLQVLIKTAEQGDAEAQYELGRMYAEGNGVPQDDVKTAYWYEKAAEQGHADAQYYLGKMYFIGKGVPKDAAKAALWMQKAAEQGHAGAQQVLGRVHSN